MTLAFASIDLCVSGHSAQLPCKLCVKGSIPGFSSLLDETKLWSHLHMTLASDGILNTNPHYYKKILEYTPSRKCASG